MRWRRLRRRHSRRSTTRGPSGRTSEPLMAVMTRTAPRRASRERRAALLFISPWIVGFLVFTAYPLIYTGYLSLTDYDVINDPNFVGLDNFRQLLQDPKVALALK